MRPVALIDLTSQQNLLRERIDRRIAKVLDHGQYIMGPEVPELEQKLSEFCGAKHVISCASGTDALLIIMMAKGIGPGSAVLCPAFTYTATPETIALLGATPVFIDVDPSTFNITAETLEAGVLEAKRRGLRAVAAIAVDLFGQPAPYDSLKPVTQEHGLFLIADAAQSFGAATNGKRVGTLGDATATSFFPAKPLGCYGDGGAILTDDEALADIMRSIRLHGKGEDKYDIVRIGVNGRLDTLQAAILLEKLAVFEDEIRARNRVALKYSAELETQFQIPKVQPGSMSVWAQYTLRLPYDQRDQVADYLRSQRIATAVYYPRPVHMQPAYAGLGAPYETLKASERLSNEVLSLPMHPYLSSDDQTRVIECLLSRRTTT